MSNDGTRRTKPGNIPALERASGRTWADWLSIFEQADAASLPHPEVARIALDAMPETVPNPEWWAQGAAIAFEQHAGLRLPGQSAAGDFRVSASRTVGFDRDEAIERWAALIDDDLLGHDLANVRRSRTEKRTFWRAQLGDAGKVEVSAEQKGDGRSLLAVQHTGLQAETDIEVWRAHWKLRLGNI